MPRVSEDEWTRKYGHGAFCHLAPRTEGIMQEVIRYVGWRCVCMGSCTRLRHHAGLYTVPLRVMTAEPEQSV